MSKETAAWLNQNCLIGFTDKRGHAWHYRESAQGTEPNHYPGAIPVEEVQRRLFDWEATEQPLFIQVGDRFVEVPDRKAITASDNHDVLGVFKSGYQPHQYSEWLIKNVANLLDDDLGIGSALLLRNRGVAVVQVEVPEAFTTPEGVEFRPNLLAATSFDGSLSTIYKRTITVAVCDNTTECALGEEGQAYRLRHSRYSTVKLEEARSALNIIFESGDQFSAELAKLCATEISQKEWNQVLDALVPVPEDKGRSRTIATKKRDILGTLWDADERVEPWRNTAWGVAQAFNTYGQHFATVKNGHRAERNFDNVLSGKIAQNDNQVLAALSEITGKSLLTV